MGILVKKIKFFCKKHLHYFLKCYILMEQRKTNGSIAKLVRLQTATLSSSVRVRLEPPSECPGGEIGRRTGLKILRTLKSVPVRLRPWAPLFKKCCKANANVIT